MSVIQEVEGRGLWTQNSLGHTVQPASKQIATKICIHKNATKMLKAATLSVTVITLEENKIAFTRYIYIMDHFLVIERKTIIQFGWISRVLYYVKIV